MGTEGIRRFSRCRGVNEGRRRKALRLLAAANTAPARSDVPEATTLSIHPPLSATNLAPAVDGRLPLGITSSHIRHPRLTHMGGALLYPDVGRIALCESFPSRLITVTLPFGLRSSISSQPHHI